MTTRSYPFVDQDVSVAEWGAMGRHWLLRGVVDGISNEVACFGDSSGRWVKVRPGTIWLNGYYWDSDAIEIVPIDPESSGNPRIDLVTARLLLAPASGVPRIELTVVKGTPAASPVAPALVNTTTEVDELLCQVTLLNGFVTIAVGDVTDKRRFATAHGAPKARGQLSGGGLGEAVNIATQTHPAGGQYVVTWVRPFLTGGGYQVQATPVYTGFASCSVYAQSATGCEIRVYDAAGAPLDPTYVHISATGDWAS